MTNLEQSNTPDDLDVRSIVVDALRRPSQEHADLEYHRDGTAKWQLEPVPHHSSRVESAASGAPSVRSRAGAVVTRRSDVDITADVAIRLVMDERIDDRKIEVLTIDGVVYLYGTVPCAAARELADLAVRATDGVLDVVNELVVMPESVRPDEEVSEKVRQALARNLRIKDNAVEVEVRHGIAKLSSSVHTVEQRWLADEIARWTPGVLDVENCLTSGGPPN